MTQPIQIGTEALKGIDRLELIDAKKVSILLGEIEQETMGEKLKPPPKFTPHPPRSGRHCPDAPLPSSAKGDNAIGFS
jgi:hypothetical protein